MKKRLLAFSLCVLMVLLLLSPAAYAGNAAADTGHMDIQNRDYKNGTFSCDVTLSGAPMAGRVFAVQYAKSGQFRNIKRYDVTKAAVKVELPDVAETDSVHILWVDANNMPVSDPEIQRVGGSSNVDYAGFGAKLLQVMQKNQPLNTQHPESPLASVDDNDRLLVSCNEPLNWQEYGLNEDDVMEAASHLYVLQFKNSDTAEKCKSDLENRAKHPSVRYVEFDSVMEVPKDRLDEDEAKLSAAQWHSWGVERSGFDEYLEAKKKSNTQQIVVAVVDTGVDENHPCLQDRLLTGYGCISSPHDNDGHGTHVSGIIAECTSGMNVKILPVCVFDSSGHTTPVIIATGIRFAADHGAHVINLSIGYSEHKETIDEAIQYALSKGITVVVAACNYTTDAMEYCPAHMEKCITVAAMGRYGHDELKRLGRSNYGKVVDIAAAGEKVESCAPASPHNENCHQTMSGTSQAAPHVAAAAALLKCEHPEYTPFQISNALKNAAEPLPVDEWDREWKDYKKKNPGAVWTDFLGAGFLDMRPFIRPVEPGPHALLYSDGTLDFRNSNVPAPGKTLVKSYKVPLTDVLQYSPWYDERDSVTKVTFSEAMQPSSTASWFYGFLNLTEVSGLDKLDTSKTTDMSKMFSRCTSLTALDLSMLNTSSVTKMKGMFASCENLTELNLTGWNTANVTEMSDMFNGCKKLVRVWASDSFAAGQDVMTPFDFTTPIDKDTTLYADWRQGGNGLIIGSGTVDVSDTNAVIPITIEKRGNLGAAALQFDVVFPDELILTQKPEVGSLFADKGLHQDVFTSPYTISLGNDTATADTTAEGVLVTLYFKLRADAAAGTYNITIQGQDNYNADVDPVTFPVTEGHVTARSVGSGLVVGTGTAAAGDTDSVIPITITKKGHVGASALQFDVVFPDALILTQKPEVGSLFADKGLHQDVFTSPYTISLGNDTATTNVTEEGVLVTLYFKVKPGTAAGHYDITLAGQDNYSVNLDNVTFPVTPGRITVSSGAASLMAGESGSLVVGSGSVKTGDADTVIPITIDKTGSAGAAALQFDMVFPDALILTAKPTVGPLFADKGLFQDVLTSPYTISLGNDTATADTTAEGNLVTLYFKVKAGAAPGTYAIRIQEQDNYNASVDSVTFGVSNGAITVLPNGETVVVTFDANGGTFNGNGTTQQVTIGKGNTVTPPTVYPVREGYSFNGWFTSGAGKVSNSVGMFNGCTAIIGQQGTTYDPAHTDIRYARIDGGTSKPGYFSKK